MTRAKIDLAARVVEFEGSEEFVTKYLEEFKSVMGKPLESIKTGVVGSEVNPAKAAEKALGKKAKTKAKGIQAEKFDPHKSETKPSLREFFDQKNPGTNNGNRIAVIAYYLRHM